MNIVFIKDYYDMYLKGDVLVLANLLENHREVSLKKPRSWSSLANYMTSPSLSWDALEKQTEQSLKLLTDNGMHLKVEKGMSGRISVVSNRHTRIKNPSKKNSWLICLDANNLNLWAMSYYLSAAYRSSGKPKNANGRGDHEAPIRWKQRLYIWVWPFYWHSL